MLEIVIKPKRLRIGRDSIGYDDYYYGVWDHNHGKDPAVPIECRVLAQWADAIERLGSSQSTADLPYSLEDESVEAFRARLIGDKVALRRVVLEGNGYLLDLDNLSEFMQQNHRLLEQDPQDFGVYVRSDLIAGLRSARIDAA